MDFNSLFVPTYKRSGAPMVRGNGMYIYDADGKEYLDFGAGIAVSALGHAHPLIVKTIKEQSELLIHASNLYFTQPQIDIAELLIKNSFGPRIFLCNSGTEANEAALKFARKWGKKESEGKYHVLSFLDGFHGRTYGALTATAQAKFHHGFEPLPEGFHYAPFNDIDATRLLLNRHSYCAIFIEPVQGEGGVNNADPEFLKFLREHCDENKIALIFDEIQCGMGRTGTLWAYEQFGVIPDMMTLAKPLGGGLPLGAVVCNEEIAKSIAPGDHGTTFGGNPLACALGVQVLKTVTDPAFLTSVKENGLYLQKKLVDLKLQFTSIDNIRGMGLLLGLRMKSDPTLVIDKCREKGMLLIKANHNTIRFIPPLIVNKDDIDKAIMIFSKALDEVEAM